MGRIDIACTCHRFNEIDHIWHYSIYYLLQMQKEEACKTLNVKKPFPFRSVLLTLIEKIIYGTWTMTSYIYLQNLVELFKIENFTKPEYFSKNIL